MSQACTSTAILSCSFGMAPVPLNVIPAAMVRVQMPVGTIMSNLPFANVPTFGMCQSIANPTVIAATAAALGVFTPMPCVPALVAPWVPGSPTVLTGGLPTLNQNCKLMCMWAGVISVVSPGQFNVSVPG